MLLAFITETESSLIDELQPHERNTIGFFFMDTNTQSKVNLDNEQSFRNDKITIIRIIKQFSLNKRNEN